MSNKSKVAKVDLVLNALRAKGMMTSAEIEELGVSREYLRRLVKWATVERVSHGLYKAPNAPISTHTTVAEASKMVPAGVVCLLSALRIHQLTTQSPFEVWIAVERRVWRPTLDNVTIRYVEMTGMPFREGVERRDIDNISVPVYCAAKTIADCFKFRNKIGIDVAVEALRDARLKKLVTIDDLWSYSKICRVSNVIRPYLEAMQ